MTARHSGRFLLGIAMSCVMLLSGPLVAMAGSPRDERLAHCRAVLDRHRSELSSVPGFTGTAVGYSTKGRGGLVILVYVRPGTPESVKGSIPTQLDGEPVEVVERQPSVPQ